MARSRRKSKTQHTQSDGASLTAVSLSAFILFSAILMVAVFVGQMTPLMALQTQHNAVLENAAQRAAGRLANSIAQYTAGLRSIASDPYTRELLQQGDAASIALRERQLQSAFEHALRVRILKPKIYSPDDSHEPHLGFACLDMQRQAEKELQAPPAEVHVLDTPQQHIDLVQPVLNAEGTEVIGHVQLALDTHLLRQWLDSAADQGYLRLQQRISNQTVLPLGEAGDPASQASGESENVDIPATRWTLIVWMPAVDRVSAFNLNLLIIMAMGVALIGVVVLMLRSSLSRAISTDLENFMQLEYSLLSGSKRHEYFLKLREFRKMVPRIEELPSIRGMERERDDDPQAVRFADLGAGMDPMYMDKNALSVEELDSAELQSTASPAPAAPRAEVKPAAKPASKPAAASPVPPAAPSLPPAEIFKAYDIRGIVGRSLTAQHALLIGQALGSEAVKRGLKKIAFGRDGRLSGPELGGALVRGLQTAGLEVIDVGMVPTPVLYYAAAELAAGSGVMLTGSHNPPDYNGFKMVLGGETLAGVAIQQLRQRIEKQDFVQGKGGYSTRQVIEPYLQRVVADVKPKRPLKVVIDCGNGVAGAVAPKLFRALGAEVIDIYSEVDGKFPNHHPDPSQPDNLHDLIELVRAQNADLGIAFDGDGDRLGVVSGDGKIIWPDRLMMLYAADVLSRNHGAQIIYDIKCSSNLTRVIWEKGGEPVMWKTGHSLIKAKMQQSGALLAGEMSGHIFFKERWYGFDDALYAGARLLEILAADMRKPRVVFAGLPDAINTPELRIDLAEGEQHRVMDELMGKVDFPDANVIMIDGVRADFAEGWGLVRASNTTPSLILRFEGKDKAAMQAVQEKFRQLLLAVKPDLKMPF